jgi:hypothetical protein
MSSSNLLRIWRLCLRDAHLACLTTETLRRGALKKENGKRKTKDGVAPTLVAFCATGWDFATVSHIVIPSCAFRFASRMEMRSRGTLLRASPATPDEGVRGYMVCVGADNSCGADASSARKLRARACFHRSPLSRPLNQASAPEMVQDRYKQFIISDFASSSPVIKLPSIALIMNDLNTTVKPF